MRPAPVTWVVLLGTLSASAPRAGDGSIGTVVRDDDPETRATRLGDADSVYTGISGSRVVLDGGSVVWLMPGSRARFRPDHMVLEKGGAEAGLSGGYRLLANQITIVPRGEATAVIALLNNDHVAVAARSGALRLESCGSTLVESLPPQRVLEFAMQAATSTPEKPPPPPATRTGTPGACNCPKPKNAAGKAVCQICPSGELSVVKGRLMIDDELRGPVELQAPDGKAPIPVYDPDKPNAPPAGKTFDKLLEEVKQAEKNKKKLRCIFCTNVVTKAEDNAGIVASIGTATCPAPARKKGDELIGRFPRPESLKYDNATCTWYWQTCDGFRYTVKPGSVYLPTEADPNQGSYGGKPPDTTLTPLACFWSGGAKPTFNKKDGTYLMTDPLTGKRWVLQLDDQLAKKVEGGIPVRICGLVNDAGGAGAGSMTVITAHPWKTPPMNAERPCLIVGRLTKEDGVYYIMDEQTGTKFKIVPTPDQEEEFDKWLDKKNPCKDKPYSLRLCPEFGLKGGRATITPPKPDKEEPDPVITFPKEKAELPPVAPGGGGIGTGTVVITTTSVAAAALITGVIVSGEGGNQRPVSVP